VLDLERQGSFELDLEAYGLEASLRALDDAGIDAAVVSLALSLELEELPEAEVEPLLAAYHEGILELVERAEGRIRPLAAARVLDGFAGSTVGGGALLDLDGLSSCSSSWRAVAAFSSSTPRRAITGGGPASERLPGDPR
jgi:hypothetical protein